MPAKPERERHSRSWPRLRFPGKALSLQPGRVFFAAHFPARSAVFRRTLEKRALAAERGTFAPGSPFRSAALGAFEGCFLSFFQNSVFFGSAFHFTVEKPCTPPKGGQTVK